MEHNEQDAIDEHRNYLINWVHNDHGYIPITRSTDAEFIQELLDRIDELECANADMTAEIFAKETTIDKLVATTERQKHALVALRGILRKGSFNSDACCICEDTIVDVNVPVMFCSVCHNVVHDRCFKMWIQTSRKPDHCVTCRQENCLSTI
jgi:hypothetical protein